MRRHGARLEEIADWLCVLVIAAGFAWIWSVLMVAWLSESFAEVLR